jgi:D-threo-aldose 1-dehydrogenase
MTTVTLPGTSLTTTRLGFGCSALLGPRTRGQALALLEAAYDASIRHFDVARSYGFGDAEGVVGEFLKRHPAGLTVTTKFGLQPNKSVARLRFLVNVARKLMRLSPALRRAIGAQARNVVKQGAFGVEDVRRSLETSLHELGKDRIDLYLLHDCCLDDCTPALLAFLQEAASAGKIAHFGTGTTIESTLEIVRARPEFGRVAQFENNVLVRNLDRLKPGSDRALITHKPLGESFGLIKAFLASDFQATQRWSRSLDANCADGGVLSGLLLSYAVAANPNGIVVFSSTNPGRIRANAQAVFDRRFTPEQVNRFTDLALEASATMDTSV